VTARRIALYALLVVCAEAASRPVAAANPLGFYVGGAVGQATVRADQVLFVDPTGIPFTGPISLSKNHAGWKLLGGLRPISLIGAEFEYVDFGSSTASHTPAGFGIGYTADMRAKAAAAFGVLYAPLPVPFLDVYGKAGLARLQTTVNANAGQGCFAPLFCAVHGGELHRDQTEVRFGYGAGTQVKLDRFAIRVEYERISASKGDPDLLSIGATWTF
jgi:opacity protein-like surface antigen